MIATIDEQAEEMVWELLDDVADFSNPAEFSYGQFTSWLAYRVQNVHDDEARITGERRGVLDDWHRELRLRSEAHAKRVIPLCVERGILAPGRGIHLYCVTRRP